MQVEQVGSSRWGSSLRLPYLASGRPFNMSTRAVDSLDSSYPISIPSSDFRLSHNPALPLTIDLEAFFCGLEVRNANVLIEISCEIWDKDIINGFALYQLRQQALYFGHSERISWVSSGVFFSIQKVCHTLSDANFDCEGTTESARIPSLTTTLIWLQNILSTSLFWLYHLHFLLTCFPSLSHLMAKSSEVSPLYTDSSTRMVA